MVDACAVLTMEGSSRIRDVWKQLDTYCPSRTLLIFENTGFKHCQKCLCEQRADYDVMHAYGVMFNVLASRFERVITFEDDFFWSSHVRNARHMWNIIRFMDHTPSVDHYMLGCIPILSLPLGRHWRVFMAGGAHAIVHSRRGMQKFLDRYANICSSSTSLIDFYLTRYGKVCAYYLPLAYQTFPMTTQREQWPPMTSRLMAMFTNLDVAVHPWYDIFYALQLITLVVIVVVVLYVGVLRGTAYSCRTLVQCWVRSLCSGSKWVVIDNPTPG